ncbi:MAG: hypothetical protein E6Q44_02145 [Flavobacteriales bacterium]|jgi:hypothetical protein|nr:MAG: hypothetical protein E6Q44_02145 [Flavobacteriales bacterium]
MALRWSIAVWGLLALAPLAQAQLFRGALPGRSVSAQYAGSVGLGSVAVMRHTKNERIGVGGSFGHTPRSHGGPLNTWTLRFMYTPWRVDLNETWQLEPVQTGLFVAYTTGLDLQASWPSYLEKGYYWWTPNFRQHLYLRSQVSHRFEGAFVQRIGAYFEVNTNDLYVYSWWPNKGSIGVGDILFFGAGVQVYFRPFAPRRNS